MLLLSPSQCKDMKVKEYLDNSQSAMREALRLWHTRNPRAATFRALLEITLKLSHEYARNIDSERKKIVAGNICHYIRENIPSQKHKSAHYN